MLSPISLGMRAALKATLFNYTGIQSNCATNYTNLSSCYELIRYLTPECTNCHQVTFNTIPVAGRRDTPVHIRGTL
jgi:hypothetical protein